MKIVKILSVVLSIIFIVTFLFLPKKNTRLECSGISIIKDDDYTMKSRASLLFSNGKGEILIDGIIEDKNGNSKNIMRMSLLDVSPQGQDLILKNYSLTKLSADTDTENLSERFITPYFYTGGAYVLLRIIPVSNEEFLISYNDYIHFFCGKPVK